MREPQSKYYVCLFLFCGATERRQVIAIKYEKTNRTRVIGYLKLNSRSHILSLVVGSRGLFSRNLVTSHLV